MIPAILLLLAPAQPPLIVENKTTPSFIVTDKSHPVPAASGCLCVPTPGGVGTCGSYLCPANGGPGDCPCAAAAAPAGYYVTERVCVNGVCRDVRRFVPSASLTPAAPKVAAAASDRGTCGSSGGEVPLASGVTGGRNWHPGKVLSHVFGGRRRGVCR